MSTLQDSFGWFAVAAPRDLAELQSTTAAPPPVVELHMFEREGTRHWYWITERGAWLREVRPISA
jgi:hypothetical protein